jgi:SAM-dependent methyltransferase
MNRIHASDDEQTRLWNGPAGQAWVDLKDPLDRLFLPFERQLVDAITAAGATRVLDVGCGTGATTLALARRIGGAGLSTGVDLSEPMIELARSRAAQEGTDASFICANAQTHTFAPASFDAIVSRFGLMFFDDPVSAFANLRAAASEGALLHGIVWRSAAENPFMTAAERAAAPLLPDLPARRADAPGQFAFADAARVAGILERSGWREIAIVPVDVPCVLPAAELDRYLTRLGPVGLVLQQADAELRGRVIAAVRAAFAPFIVGDEVHFIAACQTLIAHA